MRDERSDLFSHSSGVKKGKGNPPTMKWPRLAYNVAISRHRETPCTG